MASISSRIVLSFVFAVAVAAPQAGAAASFDGKWVGETHAKDQANCGFWNRPFELTVTGRSFTATTKDIRTNRNFDGSVGVTGNVREYIEWEYNGGHQHNANFNGKFQGDAFVGRIFAGMGSDACDITVQLNKAKGNAKAARQAASARQKKKEAERTSDIVLQYDPNRDRNKGLLQMIAEQKTEETIRNNLAGAKELAAIVAEMENNVLSVLHTIKLYQALNGAVWHQVGRELSAVRKLGRATGPAQVKAFIAANKKKRASGRAAFRYVRVNPADHIKGSNHVIATNTLKVETLRNSVDTLVNAMSGPGAFQKLAANQNVPLDEMMNAYLARVKSVMVALERAALVFDDMAVAYTEAIADMDTAIAAYKENADSVHRDMMTYNTLFFMEAAGGTDVGAQQLSEDLRAVRATFNKFQEDKRWFDAHSGEILAGSRAAGLEVVRSSEALGRIRVRLQKSWSAQMKAINAAAAAQRGTSRAFEKSLASMEREARKEAKPLKAADWKKLKSMKQGSLRGR